MRKKRWLRTAALIFGIYTLLFLIQLPQIYFYNVGSTQSPPLWFAIARLALATYIWAFLAPGILWLGKRLPVVRRHLFRNLILHFFLGLIFGVLQAFGYHLGLALISPMPISRAFEGLSNIAFFLNLVTSAVVHYITVLAIYQAYLYFQEAQEREFRLQQAELQSLKTQLHPHFLFNTMNAISALIHRDPASADETLTQLSDLLRLSLKTGKKQEVPLKEELDFLRKYLQIHQTLMKNRLEVRWLIASNTLDACVPNMILQPLVENAIRHGIGPLEDGGFLEIKTRRKNGLLCLHVLDNGLGLVQKEEASEKGIGLTNVQMRLRHLYGDAHEFSLTEPATGAGGVSVNITIPFREHAATAATMTKGRN